MHMEAAADVLFFSFFLAGFIQREAPVFVNVLSGHHPRALFRRFIFIVFVHAHCSESFFVRMPFTTCGLALPFVSFMICPMRKPTAFFLPALKSATD